MTREEFQTEILNEVTLNHLTGLLERAAVHRRTLVNVKMIGNTIVVDALFLKALWIEINNTNPDHLPQDKEFIDFENRLEMWDALTNELVRTVQNMHRKNQGGLLKEIIKALGYL